MQNRIPLAITAAVLSALLFPLTLVPLPIIATYIAWSAAIWVGEQSLLKSITKLWPPLFLGVTAGAGFTMTQWWYSTQVAEASQVFQITFLMIILAFIVAGLLLFGKTLLFKEAPAALIGFSAYNVTSMSHLSPIHSTLEYWALSILCCWAGPVLTWASIKMTFPYQDREVQRLPSCLQKGMVCPTIPKVNEHPETTTAFYSALDHPDFLDRQAWGSRQTSKDLFWAKGISVEAGKTSGE